MFKKIAPCFLLIFLFAFSPTVFSQETKSREVLIKEAVINLDSDDLRKADQAAYELGRLKAGEAVPALIRVLKSSRLLWKSNQVPPTENMTLMVGPTNVRETIVSSLGKIGDKRAVPTIKKYLIKPPKNHAVSPWTAAHALYLITGKSHKYKDSDGKVKLFQKKN